MAAEYHPLKNKYYYYTTDQINSTRVVTDDSGNVVYAAAHDPYGGVQQTWVNTFDPALKFSGKERDSESNLDYFGARYYDPTLYRFLSVDPVIPAGRALYNPQRWNLYGYCLGNPLIYVDVSGLQAENIRKLTITRTISGPSGTLGHFEFEGKYLKVSGETLELPFRGNANYISCITPDEYMGALYYWDRSKKGKKSFWVILLENKHNRTDIMVHPGNYLWQNLGCIFDGTEFSEGFLKGSEEIHNKIIADYVIEAGIACVLGLPYDSSFPTRVKVKVGEVYCEWQWWLISPSWLVQIMIIVAKAVHIL